METERQRGKQQVDHINEKITRAVRKGNAKRALLHCRINKMEENEKAPVRQKLTSDSYRLDISAYACSRKPLEIACARVQPPWGLYMRTKADPLSSLKSLRPRKGRESKGKENYSTRRSSNHHQSRRKSGDVFWYVRASDIEMVMNVKCVTNMND